MRLRKEELEANLRSVQNEISSYQVKLIVVTKTYPISDVEILKSLGVSDFGENRSDEGLKKSQLVSGNWHYQGEIQSKKIKEILSWSTCIHSLDDERHAEKIARTAGESGGKAELFLQLSLDGNPERGGLVESEMFDLAEKAAAMPAINLLGIMSVPPVEMDPAAAFAEISDVHQRFIKLFPASPYLSAGMSGDYLLALEHGATHIRVGSKILGARR
jgi:pyridoxal phosphate enzyme (YggS family)